MKVKFKKLREEAIVPSYAKAGDAGMDLTALSQSWDDERKCWVYGTGIAVEIPEGYVGLIFPRSSICKFSMHLSNSVGVIDSGYRGEIKFMFREVPGTGALYSIGDRIGQLIIMPFPKVEVEEVVDLSDTERGTEGFGSSGR